MQVDVLCTFQPESWQSAQVEANWFRAICPEFANQTLEGYLSPRKESGGFSGIPTFPWWFFSGCLPWMITFFRPSLSPRGWYGHQKRGVQRINKGYTRIRSPFKRCPKVNISRFKSVAQLKSGTKSLDEDDESYFTLLHRVAVLMTQTTDIEH